jgi:hypothetical protein
VHPHLQEHKEKLSTLNSSPNIIRVTKLRRMKWEGYVASTGEMQDAHKSLARKTECRRQLWITTWLVIENRAMKKSDAIKG